jgi:hypothetical protein
MLVFSYLLFEFHSLFSFEVSLSLF